MIDPSIRAFLRSTYTIRRFFLAYGIAFIVVASLLPAIHAYLAPGWILEWLSAFLSTLAAAVLVLLLTYAFYVFVTPPGLRNAEVIPLRSAEISDSIVDLTSNTSDYWFLGRSGSYFRSKVLPRLDDVSRKERKHIKIRAVLPDPSQDSNARRYMQMRQGLDEEADMRTLAANVIATTHAVIAAVARNPYLTAVVSLSPTVPVIRYDLSNAGGLITRDAKHLPAILVNSGNPYFEMLRDAVENELVQGTQVRWNDMAIAAVIQPETVSHEAIKLVDGIECNDESLLREASELLKRRRHRYA